MKHFIHNYINILRGVLQDKSKVKAILYTGLNAFIIKEVILPELLKLVSTISIIACLVYIFSYILMSLHAFIIFSHFMPDLFKLPMGGFKDAKLKVNYFRTNTSNKISDSSSDDYSDNTSDNDSVSDSDSGGSKEDASGNNKNIGKKVLKNNDNFIELQKELDNLREKLIELPLNHPDRDKFTLEYKEKLVKYNL